MQVLELDRFPTSPTDHELYFLTLFFNFLETFKGKLYDWFSFTSSKILAMILRCFRKAFHSSMSADIHLCIVGTMLISHSTLLLS